MDCNAGNASGGDEVYLLCDKVQKGGWRSQTRLLRVPFLSDRRAAKQRAFSKVRSFCDLENKIFTRNGFLDIYWSVYALILSVQVPLEHLWPSITQPELKRYFSRKLRYAAVSDPVVHWTGLNAFIEAKHDRKNEQHHGAHAGRNFTPELLSNES